MKISAITSTHNISFGKGTAFLYTDFDWTFFPQTMRDFYQGTPSEKENATRAFNKFFAQIENFIQKAKDNFSLTITTGRRLYGDARSGFEPTYKKLCADGVIFPSIKRVITADGGDIHRFLSNGEIDRFPNPEKTEYMKKLCGWDKEKIIQALDETAQKTNTKYTFVRPHGTYNLFLTLNDKSKLNEFNETLIKKLSPQMGISSEVTSDVVFPAIFGDGIVYEGINMRARINGEPTRKIIDTRLAVKQAVLNNDFIIVAGDSTNDREMLNIFRYLDISPEKIPVKAEDLTEAFALEHKAEIEKLPVKLLFIKSKEAYTKEKVREVYDFMEKLQTYYPNQVKVVERTVPGEKNNYLDAVKSAIFEYAQRNKKFKKELFENKELCKELNIKRSKAALWIIAGVVAIGGVLWGFKDKFFIKYPVRKGKRRES